MRMRKKGALELSINAIVIVILAMTLLGLGLGFVRGLFNKVNRMSDDTFDKMQEQLNVDLSTSDEAVLFSKTRLTLERNSNTLEALGVRNDGDREIKYGIKVLTFTCPGTGTCPEAEDWFEYFKGDSEYELPNAQRQVNRMQIAVGSGVDKGLYLLKIMVYKGEWPSSGEPVDCVDYDPDAEPPTGCDVFGQTELFLTVA